MINTGITLTTNALNNPAIAQATREATRTIASQVAPAFISTSKAAKSTVGQVIKRPDPNRVVNALTGQGAVREVRHLAAA